MFWGLALTSLVGLGGVSEASAACELAAPIARLTGFRDVLTTSSATRDFGGISGLDRRGRHWLMISDDRSARAPARLYPARIAFRGEAIANIWISPPRLLRDQTGRPFPRPGTNGEAVDAEAIRFDPKDGTIVWSSEGDARDGFAPGLRRQARAAAPSRPLALPASLMETPTAGPRPNLAFEGLSFSTDRKALWIALEAPLKQDGALASRTAGALVRLSRLGPAGAVSQFAYRTDPVEGPDQGLRADNGVSEILTLDAQRLLVLERSGVEVAPGRFTYNVRLYVADLRGATNVAGLASLGTASPTPAAKTLVFDFHAAGQDRNFEAMAWGPRLGRDARVLVLAEDNNFEAGASRFVSLRVDLKAGGICGG